MRSAESDATHCRLAPLPMPQFALSNMAASPAPHHTNQSPVFTRLLSSSRCVPATQHSEGTREEGHVRRRSAGEEARLALGAVLLVERVTADRRLRLLLDALLRLRVAVPRHLRRRARRMREEDGGEGKRERE